MPKHATNRAASKASRNHSNNSQSNGAEALLKKLNREERDFIRRFAASETAGDEVAMLENVLREGKKLRERHVKADPLPNLKKIVAYEIPGVHDTADTLYWGGRWPDDFFLSRKCSDEPPKRANIADVFAWLATIQEIARYGFVADVDECHMGILYHAASLELRLDPTPECANTSEKYAAIRARDRAKN